MIEKVRETIKKYGLISGGAVVAAVSGGADSTALMISLSELKEELGFSLIAAHFNHGIRETADRDEEFCRALAEKLGLPFYSKKEDVPRVAETKGLSLETAARLERYAFLFDVMEKTGACAIASAHHMDDSAESILMHLLRGSGLAGLTGIKPKTEITETEFTAGREPSKRSAVVIRPLIEASKKEILAFLEERGQEYCTDETNFIDDTARNYLRLNIVPALERINPKAVRNIVRSGGILSEDEEYLDDIAEKALEEAAETDGYNCEKLLSLPAPVRKRAIRLAIRASSVLTDVEAVHIESVDRLLLMQSGAGVDIPHSRARVSFGRLIIENSGSGKKTAPGAECFIPLEEGEYETPFGVFTLRFISVKPMEKPGEVEYNIRKASENGAFTACMDAKSVKEGFTVRTRRPGDRFRPVNSEWRMKLKDFFISRRVDEKKRDCIPLVVSGGEIVFIPGLLIADGVKVTGSTEKVLILNYKE